MTKLSIGIVTYDSGRVIGPTLDALFAHWPETLETRLFIVDNESSDDTLAQVAPYRDRLSVVASPKGNMGFGAAHNLLLPMLDSDYHCIMNPDVTLVERATLPTIVAFLEAHPDVGMAVPRILDPAGGVQHLCRRDPTVLDVLIRFLGPERVLPARQRRHMMMDHDYATSFDVPFASGCFLVVRTALLRQLGGFDERIFL